MYRVNGVTIWLHGHRPPQNSNFQTTYTQESILFHGSLCLNGHRTWAKETIETLWRSPYDQRVIGLNLRILMCPNCTNDPYTTLCPKGHRVPYHICPRVYLHFEDHVRTLRPPGHKHHVYNFAWSYGQTIIHLNLKVLCFLTGRGIATWSCMVIVSLMANRSKRTLTLKGRRT